MPPDSSELDNAVIARLQGDATLLGMMTDGVYIDVAPPGSERFVIVSLLASADGMTFSGREYEEATYLVKAVGLWPPGASGTPPDMKGAAARIDALLHDAAFTATGYGAITAQREDRVRLTEVDEQDSTIRWQHRGGRYRVMASPAD